MYMRAHVRLVGRVDMTGLDQLDVVALYGMLPEPAITFADWLARLKIGSAESSAPSQDSGPVNAETGDPFITSDIDTSNLSADDIMKNNTNALALLATTEGLGECLTIEDAPALEESA